MQSAGGIGVVRAAFSLTAGALLCQLSSFPPNSDLLLAALVLLVMVLPLLRRGDLLWLGFGALLFVTSVRDAQSLWLDVRFAGDSILTEVLICDFVRHDERNAQFYAQPLHDARISGTIQLSWHEPPVRPRIGDIWQLELRLRRPRGASNPGGRDFVAYALREGISATGYVAAGRHNRLIDSNTSRGIDALRIALLARLSARVEAEAGAVLAAIGLGARHRISREQWDRYARTGTSHLMAISGLHIGLAATAAGILGTLLFTAVGGRCRAYRHSLLLAVAVAAAYAALSGFAVPAQRALTMLAFAALMLLRLRERSGLRLMSAALIVVLLADPLASMAPGFRLSFGAVAVLIWLAARTPLPAGRRRHRLPLTLWQMQLMLLCGLLPLTVAAFDRFALAALPVNLLAVPLFGLITVPCTLLGLCLGGPLAPAGDFLLHVAGFSIDWLERGIGVAADWPLGSRSIPEISGGGWLWLLLPLIWVLLPPGWPGRAVALPALLMLSHWQPPALQVGCMRATVLDVGQGQALVVETRAHTLVYDTGPAWRSGGSAAAAVVLPYLQSRGIGRLDRVIVSHADLDHAGGLNDLQAALAIDEVVAGESLPGVPARPCTASEQWRWDGVAFEFLHPPAGGRLEGNDASCVVLVAAGSRRLLLSGDIESAGEAQLIRSRRLPTVDAATVPHHGSRTSSSPPLLRALSARHAIVSSGYGNRWGFPRTDIVARWRDAGASVHTTAKSGAITLEFCAGDRELRVSRHREQARRLWHASDF